MKNIEANKIIKPVLSSDGAGVKLKRSIGIEPNYFDPFLMLDEFGSEDKGFDILNKDTGNISMYLHQDGDSTGINTGNFKWIHGKTNNELMTLTYGGNLGINQSTPTDTLHVVGTSTVTGNSFVGGNLDVKTNLIVSEFEKLLKISDETNTKNIIPYLTINTSYSKNLIF